MSAPIRVAVVGAGSMGSLHARVLAQSSRAALAFVVDPDPVVGGALADRFATMWRADLGDTSRLDAVVVAAPTQAHPQLGREVLERGLATLLEKPLADDIADVEELIGLSTKMDVPLMCGLLERFNPALMTALAIAAAPRHVTARRHSPYVPRIRTGVCSDLLIHDVDVALRLAGTPPIATRGSLGYLHPESAPGSEDVAEAFLAFPDGLLANVSASRISQRKTRALEIAEVDRLIEVDMVRNAVTIFRHVLNEVDPDGLSYKQQTIIEIPALVTAREPLAAQLDHFLDLVEGRADAEAERASILPAHRVIHDIRAAATGDPA